MAVKNTPQRIARRSGVKVPLARLVFGFPEGMSREEGRPVSRAKKNGSKSLNEQKLASGVSGFPPEIQDGLHGFRDRQIRRIQHRASFAGASGRALGIARIPLAHIPQKVVKISRNSLSINCLRRLSARATTSATRKTLRDASGNTTVPMSRRRPPGPAARGRPAGAPAAPGARRETPPRGKRSCPPFTAYLVADVAASRQTCGPSKRTSSVSATRHRRLVPGGHAPGAWRPGPSGGRARRCPAHPSPAPWRRGAPRCPCRRRSARRW